MDGYRRVHALQMDARFSPPHDGLVVDADLTNFAGMPATGVLQIGLLTFLHVPTAVGERMLTTVDVDLAYVVELAAPLRALAGEVAPGQEDGNQQACYSYNISPR